MNLFGKKECGHEPLIAQLRADLAAADVRADEWSTVAADARSDRDTWRGMYEQERKRYDELLQTVLAMKVKGADVVPVANSAVTPPDTAAPDPDELKALIAEQCGTDLRKRAMMLRQLSLDRAAKTPDEQIRKDILAGVSVAGVPA